VVRIKALPIGDDSAVEAMIKSTACKYGAAAFPAIAKLKQDASTNQHYKDNVVLIVLNTKPSLKEGITLMSGANISVKQFARDTGCKPKYVSNVRCKFRKDPKKNTRKLVPGQSRSKKKIRGKTPSSDEHVLPLFAEIKKDGTRVTLDPCEIVIAVRFYDRNTSHHSGDHAKPTKMHMSLREFHNSRVASYPQMLREENIESGNQLFERCRFAKNKFQKAVLAAIHAGDVDGFCATDEYNVRKDQLDYEYFESLQDKRAKAKSKRPIRRVGRPSFQDKKKSASPAFRKDDHKHDGNAAAGATAEATGTLSLCCLFWCSSYLFVFFYCFLLLFCV
jgi:hypothetical protein